MAAPLDLDEVLKEGLKHLVGVNLGDYRPFFSGWKLSFRLGREIEVHEVMPGKTPGIPLVLLTMTRTGQDKGSGTELMRDAIIGPPYPALENPDQLVTDGVSGTESTARAILNPPITINARYEHGGIFRYAGGKAKHSVRAAADLTWLSRSRPDIRTPAKDSSAMPSLTAAAPANPLFPAPTSDYRLTGDQARRAVVQGLAEATWYQCPVDAPTMRSLLVRRDWPAIRDTLIWFSVLLGTASAGIALWGSWWAILPFAIYGVIYASTSDSRWHEASHGTAFKTSWLNDALYEIASFMVMRESTLWRWSHIRHHSDTIIVGRDPEIVFPRPSAIANLVPAFTGIGAFRSYLGKLFRHAGGTLDPEEQTYVPRDQWRRVVLTARIHIAVYALVIVTAVLMDSWLPLVLIGLPNFYGSWLMPIYGATQHAGLAENVLDHRLNCRTVLMNRLNRFLYWNMNYHIEHHMFPMVPYHQLPRLHAAVAGDMPKPYRSLWEAWREIIAVLRRQPQDPTYFVRREVPAPIASGSTSPRSLTLPVTVTNENWWDLGPADSLARECVARADQGDQTLAIYRHGDGSYHATDGLCTHGRVHLAEGLVHGHVIECPKHNGRFDLRDGTVRRAPACAAIASYPTRIVDGRLQVNPCQGTTKEQVRRFRVVGNQHLTAFIREMVVEPVAEGSVPFTPGDYLRFVIPPYPHRTLDDLDIPAAFAPAWERAGVGGLTVANSSEVRRNYSLANSLADGRRFRFTVRLALPPAGSGHPMGVGSTYLWSLRPGDEIDAAGPFGDFHLRPGTGEVIAIGGGAGMAPLRSHIAHLLEVDKSTRRIRLWYGARTRRDLFYEDYFANLARRFPNFTFQMALSEPAAEDTWEGPTGFIHQVVERELFTRPDQQRDADFYLCGPPAMMQATMRMLQTQGIDRRAISCDEF